MVDDSKQTIVEQVFTASSTEQSRELYDEWAKTYDGDMTEHKFTAPHLVAEAVARGLKVNHLGNEKESLRRIVIIDAGCGTGLVGVELAKLGAKRSTGSTSAKLCWTLPAPIARIAAAESRFMRRCHPSQYLKL
jgi:predicted TPR repeat methyltransferase